MLVVHMDLCTTRTAPHTHENKLSLQSMRLRMCVLAITHLDVCCISLDTKVVCCVMCVHVCRCVCMYVCVIGNDIDVCADVCS